MVVEVTKRLVVVEMLQTKVVVVVVIVVSCGGELVVQMTKILVW